MKHFAARFFWDSYGELAPNIRKMADEYYDRLKTHPQHPSLHFKKIGRFRSVRVGLHHRALAVEIPDGLVWFWIGTHDQYQKMIKKEG